MTPAGHIARITILDPTAPPSACPITPPILLINREVIALPTARKIDGEIRDGRLVALPVAAPWLALN